MIYSNYVLFPVNFAAHPLLLVKYRIHIKINIDCYLKDKVIIEIIGVIKDVPIKRSVILPRPLPLSPPPMKGIFLKIDARI